MNQIVPAKVLIGRAGQGILLREAETHSDQPHCGTGGVQEKAEGTVTRERHTDTTSSLELFPRAWTVGR